uniref:Uncharacterized protein n=1 Tax=Romanomermis culicivorax TaxID=13658 RepID=A0A915KT37_ROMCU
MIDEAVGVSTNAAGPVLLTETMDNPDVDIVLETEVYRIENPGFQSRHFVATHRVTHHDVAGHIGREFGQKAHLDHVDGHVTFLRRLQLLTTAPKNARQTDLVDRHPFPFSQSQVQLFAVRQGLDFVVGGGGNDRSGVGVRRGQARLRNSQCGRRDPEHACTWVNSRIGLIFNNI